MKKLLIHTFFTPKVLGPVSALITGLVAAWLFAVLPGAPEFVTVVLDLAMDIAAGREPEATPGDTITVAELVAFLGPIVALGLSSWAQRLVASDANKVLQFAKDNGEYDGPLDGWAGDQAFSGLVRLVESKKKPDK